MKWVITCPRAIAANEAIEVEAPSELWAICSLGMTVWPAHKYTEVKALMDATSKPKPENSSR